MFADCQVLDGFDMAFYRAAWAWIKDIHKLVADFYSTKVAQKA
jgi:hypothetical protein